MQRGEVLQDLHAAAVAVHVAEGADIHENVEAEFLAAAIGARDFVVASAMTQPQVDDLSALGGSHALNHAANLPIGMVQALIKESCRQLNLERFVFQQINKRSGIDSSGAEYLGGGSSQLAAALQLVNIGFGVLHQRRSGMDLTQKHGLHTLAQFSRLLLDLVQHALGTRVVHVVCGVARRFLQ